MRTASGSARPSLAARVSAACWLGLSPGPSATAMPPCAQALALSASVSLVTRVAACPSEASRQAVQSPAIPVPTITGRGEGMGGIYRAERRKRRKGGRQREAACVIPAVASLPPSRPPYALTPFRLSALPHV